MRVPPKVGAIRVLAWGEGELLVLLPGRGAPPARVRRLALLDPTDCVGGLALRYRVCALPLFARPSRKRLRAFLAWETGGRVLDPDWLRLAPVTVGVVETATHHPMPIGEPGELADRLCGWLRGPQR